MQMSRVAANVTAKVTNKSTRRTRILVSLYKSHRKDLISCVNLLKNKPIVLSNLHTKPGPLTGAKVFVCCHEI